MDKIDFSMTVSTLKVSLLTHQNVLGGFYDNHLTGRNKKEYIVCVKICFFILWRSKRSGIYHCLVHIFI